MATGIPQPLVPGTKEYEGALPGAVDLDAEFNKMRVAAGGQPSRQLPRNYLGPETAADAADRMSAVGRPPPSWAMDEYANARWKNYQTQAPVADPFLQRLAADAARRAAGQGLYTDQMIGDQSALARGMYASQGAAASGLRQPAAMRAATMRAAGAGTEVNAAMQGQRRQEMARAAQDAAAAQNALWKQNVGRTLIGRQFANARDAGALDWLGMGLTDEQEAAKARQEWQSMAEQYRQQSIDNARAQNEEEAGVVEDIVGGIPIGGGLGKAAMRAARKSDVRAKKNIAPARGEARSLLDALAREGPKRYDYLEGFGPSGKQFGPMAQTLQKGGPMGENMVGTDEEGMRYLKLPEMTKGLAAAIAEQQRQIRALEDRTVAQPRSRKVREGGAVRYSYPAAVAPAKIGAPSYRNPFADEPVMAPAQINPMRPGLMIPGAADMTPDEWQYGIRTGQMPSNLKR